MRTAFDLGSATIPAVRRPNWSSRIEHLSMIRDRKSTRLNSSHGYISYAVFCLKKKKTTQHPLSPQHDTHLLVSFHSYSLSEYCLSYVCTPETSCSTASPAVDYHSQR